MTAVHRSANANYPLRRPARQPPGHFAQRAHAGAGIGLTQLLRRLFCDRRQYPDRQPQATRSCAVRRAAWHPVSQSLDVGLSWLRFCPLQFADYPAKCFCCFRLAEIRVVSLLYSDPCQGEMQIWLYAMAIEATQYTMKRTTIDGDDPPARLSNTHERGDITADAGNARHFRVPLAVQADCDMVRQLCRARAARARVHDRHFTVVSSHGAARDRRECQGSRDAPGGRPL